MKRYLSYLIRAFMTSQLVLAVFLLMSIPASAQQIHGVPGSANATVTLDGKQLPPPPMPFGGVIKESATDSKPWWPPVSCRPRVLLTSYSL